jgi:hypothetical protein
MATRGRQIGRSAPAPRGRALPRRTRMAQAARAGAMRDQLYDILRREGQRSVITRGAIPARGRVTRNRVDRELMGRVAVRRLTPS